jgi:uncharacterized integral membrane protein
MFRVILSIVLLVILVVLIVANLGEDYTTSFNLIVWKSDKVPVTAVALVAFAVGILYSFAYYVGRYFSKISKSKFRKKGEQVKAREQELKEKERELGEQAEELVESQGALQTGADDSEGEPPKAPATKARAGRKKRRK